MAGDWIKMRIDLASDPAVIRIRRATGLDADSVVGKLHRLWAWADQHTRDGKAPGVDVEWVDELVGVPGFGAAMVASGWLAANDGGIRFANFDRHNGKSAKVRALGKTRMERIRCATSATKSEQERNQRREEKRREEEKQYARADGEPAAALRNGKHPAPPQPHAAPEASGDDWRRPGWVHDEWAKIVHAWNVTERAAPWTLATPPNGFADLAASPGWLDSAMSGIAMLPACRRFERPVPWTQFVRDLDRILAGEFRDPPSERRELAAAGAGGRQQRRGNMR